MIAWSTDVQHKFKNPDPGKVDTAKVNEWLNEEIFPGKVENGHFIVWMRNAALPNFRSVNRLSLISVQLLKIEILLVLITGLID